MNLMIDRCHIKMVCFAFIMPYLFEFDNVNIKNNLHVAWYWYIINNGELYVVHIVVRLLTYADMIKP